MLKEKEAERLKQRYRKLAMKLAAMGPIIQGTITERVIARQTGKDKQTEKNYGPYYQWTYKSGGKTVTVNLTAQQAKLFNKAIQNNRILEETLTEMRTLSRQLCESSVEGVKKRSRRQPRSEP
jgi:hypothetical protein